MFRRLGGARSGGFIRIALGSALATAMLMTTAACRNDEFGGEGASAGNPATVGIVGEAVAQECAKKVFDAASATAPDLSGPREPEFGSWVLSNGGGPATGTSLVDVKLIIEPSRIAAGIARGGKLTTYVDLDDPESLGSVSTVSMNDVESAISTGFTAVMVTGWMPIDRSLLNASLTPGTVPGIEFGFSAPDTMISDATGYAVTLNTIDNPDDKFSAENLDIVGPADSDYQAALDKAEKLCSEIAAAITT